VPAMISRPSALQRRLQTPNELGPPARHRRQDSGRVGAACARRLTNYGLFERTPGPLGAHCPYQVQYAARQGLNALRVTDATPVSEG